ncbi:hypothetical protein GCM10022210_28710 [Mucilaginibacter dorajii]|uniref:Uncharacterized protein n=1 Tax=Mucilaginibacter dorajii TaxID=692994 RepID=A0ABP7Q4Z0_9SPHI
MRNGIGGAGYDGREVIFGTLGFLDEGFWTKEQGQKQRAVRIPWKLLYIQIVQKKCHFDRAKEGE